MNLAKLLATRRASRGLSYQAVATAANTAKSNVHDMEAGIATNPKVDTIFGLAKALGLKPEAVLYAAAESQELTTRKPDVSA